MTTDITELEQREKFEVWAHSQKLSLAYGDCGYAFSSTEMAWRAWMASSAELVEALEKAQQQITQLESRTVKLPEPFKLAKSSSGLTYYYADEVDAALTAAGIKVEAE
ncbi:TPA: hypothetical protein L9139_001685 [Klebsiella pneumoniae]|nr:hypothetical protein [Klebsiella pneumoniae]